MEAVDGELMMTLWYPGGQMALQGAKVDGEREGPWRGWHENGRREGPWSFWMEDGTLEVEFSGTYASGRRVGP
jgi:antitoxin component YwqK of YwqJK toxin-antitoxin module